MKAFRSIAFITAVVGAMIFVASPTAKSQLQANLPVVAEAIALSIVADHCPTGCTCKNGCTCGCANPCADSDCKKSCKTENGCKACCANSSPAIAVCSQKCATM